VEVDEIYQLLVFGLKEDGFADEVELVSVIISVSLFVEFAVNFGQFFLEVLLKLVAGHLPEEVE
jgi:hypothetical protein